MLTGTGSDNAPVAEKVDAMALSEQLRQVLARDGILPADPGEAVRGSELVARVRPLVSGSYAHNSFLQTFSYLAGDPTSPLARAEGKYGYYRRPTPLLPVPAAPVANDEAPLPATGVGRREGQPEEKFRAFYLRHVRLNSSFPVHVEHTSAAHQPGGVNKWKFPDVVVLDWEVGEQRDDGFTLDQALLEVKRSLGEQPFRLASVELKVELSLSNFREHFFQCVSNSKWAHLAQLVVATPIADALLAAELRRLGASYGVAISYFPLARERLNGLPAASEILAMSDDDFETLSADALPVSVATGTPRADLDWDHLRDMRAQSSEFRDLFDWIARCLRDGRAYTFDNFLALRRIELETG